MEGVRPLAPGLWESLRAEADNVVGAPGCAIAIGHRALDRLTVADRTVRETLRLHPAGGRQPPTRWRSFQDPPTHLTGAEGSHVTRVSEEMASKVR